MTGEAGLPATTASDVVAEWYRPSARIRVGILLLGEALRDDETPVDEALTHAGHMPVRRKCRLQARPRESRARLADVLEFIQLYGSEYALAIVKSWPEVAGCERDLIEALHDAGCAVVWESTDDEDPHVAVEWGVDALTVAPRPV